MGGYACVCECMCERRCAQLGWVGAVVYCKTVCLPECADMRVNVFAYVGHMCLGMCIPACMFMYLNSMHL